MDFPQYHAPELPATAAMYLIPTAFAAVGVAMLVFIIFNALKSVGHDKYDGRAAFGVLLLVVMAFVGTLTSYHAAYKPHDKAQEKATVEAIQAYRGKVASYIDNVYGVKITKSSARDLVKGKETAGVAPSGETITLSLLNRDQKNPVLIGTDHNPIPKYDRLTAE